MPPNVNSNISFAKTTLPYPIFAADFDPYNRGYLIVGGGGGEGRSGVPNQISVLDVSDRKTIKHEVDIELSRDEDSVQSLGSLASKDGLIVFAGVNSSQKEQDAGKNEHLRSWEVRYAPRKKQKTEDEKDEKEAVGESKMLGKRSLFKPSTAAKKETYQRILRLSPSIRRESGSKRIGAIATGAPQPKDSQVIVFNATNSTPESSDVLTTINLDEGEEAADLDIAEPEQGTFSLAYCTNYDLYEQTLKYDFSRKRTEKTPKGPRRVHQLPLPDQENPKSRPKFRCLRFLNAQNLIALSNKAGRSGSELLIYHLYPTGPAIQVQQKALPSRIKQTVSMDVCALDADKEGNQQFVLAVAGQDISIEVYTTNYQRNTDSFSPLKSYMTFRDVHQHQMTKLCFSPFHPPASKTSVEQYIRLASVSMGNSVVVDTFPLQILDDPNKEKKARYVLLSPSDEIWAKWTYFLVISLIVLVLAFLIQSFLPQGFNRGPYSLLPKSAREHLDKPIAHLRGGEYHKVSSNAGDGPGHLHSLQIKHSQGGKEKEKAILIRSAPAGKGGVTVDVHPDKAKVLAKNPEARHWHELAEAQKVVWKGRLVQAGEWAEAEGETVLKGMLFSEYAGLVGEGVGHVMREL